MQDQNKQDSVNGGDVASIADAGFSRRQFLDVLAKSALVTSAFSVIAFTEGCGGGGGGGGAAQFGSDLIGVITATIGRGVDAGTYRIALTRAANSTTASNVTGTAIYAPTGGGTVASAVVQGIIEASQLSLNATFEGTSLARGTATFNSSTYDGTPSRTFTGNYVRTAQDGTVVTEEFTGTREAVSSVPTLLGTWDGTFQQTFTPTEGTAENFSGRLVFIFQSQTSTSFTARYNTYSSDNVFESAGSFSGVLIGNSFTISEVDGETGFNLVFNVNGNHITGQETETDTSGTNVVNYNLTKVSNSTTDAYGDYGSYGDYSGRSVSTTPATGKNPFLLLRN